MAPMSASLEALRAIRLVGPILPIGKHEQEPHRNTSGKTTAADSVESRFSRKFGDLREAWAPADAGPDGALSIFVVDGSVGSGSSIMPGGF
jgi:hypothetical protein